MVSLVLQFQSGSIWNVQIAEGLLKLVVKECLYTSIVNFYEDGQMLRNGRKERAREEKVANIVSCLLYTSPSPRDKRQSRMPSSA